MIIELNFLAHRSPSSLSVFIGFILRLICFFFLLFFYFYLLARFERHSRSNFTFSHMHTEIELHEWARDMEQNVYGIFFDFISLQILLSFPCIRNCLQSEVYRKMSTTIFRFCLPLFRIFSLQFDHHFVFSANRFVSASDFVLELAWCALNFVASVVYFIFICYCFSLIFRTRETSFHLCWCFASSFVGFHFDARISVTTKWFGQNIFK